MNLNHVELLRLFWGNHYCETDWMFVPPADVVGDWLFDNNVRIWGYSHNDMLLATLMFRRIGEDPWTTMSVDCICVHRDVRGRGRTAMLLENVILQGFNMDGYVRKMLLPFLVIGRLQQITFSIILFHLLEKNTTSGLLVVTVLQ
jgi:hypothetical protein